jgi:hypothetical protein
MVSTCKYGKRRDRKKGKYPKERFAKLQGTAQVMRQDITGLLIMMMAA